MVIIEAKSPDGKLVATVFSCSGGGAAGYTCTNVNLRKAGDDCNQRDLLDHYATYTVSEQDLNAFSSWTA